MPNFTQLSIPEPCHENWATMHPSEKGKFCDLCQKEVIDFTTWTDDAVIQYFELNPQQICGRLAENQLVRINQILTTHAPKQPNLWRVFAWALSATTLVASGAKAMETQHTTLQSKNAASLTPPIEQIPIIQPIKGYIYDSYDNQPIKGAMIEIENLGCVAYSDENGAFTIASNLIAPQNSITLSISKAGYHTQEKVLNVNDSNFEIYLTTTTQLQTVVVTGLGFSKTSNHISGYAVVIGKSKKKSNWLSRLWLLIKNTFKKEPPIV
jgi:hypothetical protein